MKKSSIFKAIISVVLVLVAVNTLLLGRMIFVFEDRIEEAEEAARPAELDIVQITDSACPLCFDIGSIVEQIKGGNVLIGDEKVLDVSDKEARELMRKYSIEKVPTFLVSGEIKKDKSMIAAWEDMGNVQEDTVVFSKVLPPYHEVSSGDIRGLVGINILHDPSCGADCASPNTLLGFIEGLGLPTGNHEAVDLSSDYGSKLRRDYDIKKVPTVILNGELELYPAIKSVWGQLGSVEDDGTYVLRNLDLLRGMKYKEL